MSLRTLSFLVALLLPLAGCLSGGADQPSSSSPAPSTSVPPTTTSAPPPTTSVEPQPPSASATVSAGSGPLSPSDGVYTATAGVNLTFDASSSSDPDGGSVSAAWDFGDGASAAGLTATHAFGAAGNFTVTLTVTDDESQTDTETLTFVVGAGAGPSDHYFLDDADAPATWTLHRYVVFYDNVAGEAGENVVEDDHPLSAGWHTTAADKWGGSKSWTMQDEDAKSYHDNEYTEMISPTIDLTAATSANLSFYVFGDAEANNYEGLYWYASGDNGETFKELGKTAKSGNASVEPWSLRYADLAEFVGKQVKIKFVFKSDSSCSADSEPPVQPVQLCGAGDFTGFFIDDIKVAPV